MSVNGASRLKPVLSTYHQVIGSYGPTGDRVLYVGSDISKWIEEQPAHLWKNEYLKGGISSFRDCYIIADELYTLMLLRWAD